MITTLDRASSLILNGYNAWEADRASGLAALDGPEGLRLGSAASAVRAVSAPELDKCFLDHRLAPTGDGGWLLVDGATVKRLRACAGVKEGFALVELRPEGELQPVALAAGPESIALLDGTHPAVLILDPSTLRVRGLVDLRPLRTTPSIIAWVTRRLLLVISNTEAVLVAVSGEIRHRAPAGILGGARRAGLVKVDDGEPEAVIAVAASLGWYQLFRLRNLEVDCVPLDPSRVSCCKRRVAATWPGGFCVSVAMSSRCFSWDGAHSSLATPPPAPPLFATTGRLVTRLLDGGRDDAAWTRIRLDGDRPAGTAIVARAVTQVTADEVVQDSDWRLVPANATDAQLRLPPGRYLRLRVDLEGDGSASPTLRSVRLDIEPPSTLDVLPAVYRRDPLSADFTRRFLGLFDAELDDADAVIERSPRMLDPRATGRRDHLGRELDGGAEREAVAALAGLVGVDLDASWSLENARELLRRPGLLARRGTSKGLGELLRLLFGVSVDVEELARRRAWGALRSARLSEVRLFSRASIAVRLGSSRLGVAPLDANAEPEQAASVWGAFQAVVHVNASHLDADRRAGLSRTVEAFTPAHVDVTVRFSDDATVLGTPQLVGVDTRIGAPRTVVLRQEEPGTSARLGSAVLRGARARTVTVGRRAHVGLDATVG